MSPATSIWLAFGFNALMLMHESNQQPTNFNDSGDTSSEHRSGHGAGLFAATAEHADELLDAGFADDGEEA